MFHDFYIFNVRLKKMISLIIQLSTPKPYQIFKIFYDFYIFSLVIILLAQKTMFLCILHLRVIIIILL